MAICALFLITQLYKHSTPTESFEKLEGKAEEYERRPVVLPVISLDEFVYKEPWNSFFKQKHNVLRQKVDWHNQTHIQLEKGRRGPGEQGKKFKLTDPEDIKRNTMLMRVNGYYAVASDIISPNRSVNDIRHPLYVDLTTSIKTNLTGFVLLFLGAEKRFTTQNSQLPQLSFHFLMIIYQF